MYPQQFSFLAAVVLCSLLNLSSAQNPIGDNSLARSQTTTTLSNLSIQSTKPNATSKVSTPASTTGASNSSNKIIKVVVGSPTLNKSLVFTPNEIQANSGDIIQFQFSQVNHTVTQSSFAEPCLPIQHSDPAAAGINSGFVPGGDVNATMVQTFNMPINDTKPTFIYCAQGPHCMLGMVMTINPNGTENLAAYKAAAANATKNVPAMTFRGGVLGTIPKSIAVAPPV